MHIVSLEHNLYEMLNLVYGGKEEKYSNIFWIFKQEMLSCNVYTVSLVDQTS